MPFACVLVKHFRTTVYPVGQCSYSDPARPYHFVSAPLFFQMDPTTYPAVTYMSERTITLFFPHPHYRATPFNYYWSHSLHHPTLSTPDKTVNVHITCRNLDWLRQQPQPAVGTRSTASTSPLRRSPEEPRPVEKVLYFVVGNMVL